MVDLITCPSCATQNPSGAFFCMQCGKTLRVQLSTTVSKQATMYIVSALFPPFGLGWGFKYVRQSDPYLKRIGIAIIIITVVSLLLNIWILAKLYGNYFKLLNNINNIDL
jgi:uncharacterized membrane protein YvbJ